jgi:hypothetical protein
MQYIYLSSAPLVAIFAALVWGANRPTLRAAVRIRAACDNLRCLRLAQRPDRYFGQ